jgi:hypothetical protein
MEDQNKEKRLDIELSEEVATGHYVNMAIISHSSSEFVIDFTQIMPGVPKAKVKSRVILTPQHAKRLLRAINENIQRYESMHGQINEPAENMPPFNLGTPKAEA